MVHIQMPGGGFVLADSEYPCNYENYSILVYILFYYSLGGANPAVNTPRPSRGTRIESCDFIVLIGDP